MASDGRNPDADLAAMLAQINLFPTTAGTLDVIVAVAFDSGAYSAQVTSADNTGGEVLLGTYAVPWFSTYALRQGGCPREPRRHLSAPPSATNAAHHA